MLLKTLQSSQKPPPRSNLLPSFFGVFGTKILSSRIHEADGLPCRNAIDPRIMGEEFCCVGAMERVLAVKQSKVERSCGGTDFCTTIPLTSSSWWQNPHGLWAGGEVSRTEF